MKKNPAAFQQSFDGQIQGPLLGLLVLLSPLLLLLLPTTYVMIAIYTARLFACRIISTRSCCAAAAAFEYCHFLWGLGLL